MVVDRAAREGLVRRAPSVRGLKRVAPWGWPVAAGPLAASEHWIESPRVTNGAGVSGLGRSVGWLASIQQVEVREQEADDASDERGSGS